MSCISPQETVNDSFFEKEVKTFNGEKFICIEPDYRGVIPSNLLRRMSYLVRMTVGISLPLLNENADINGIIFSSSNSGKDRSMRFLEQIVDYNEGTLTPTDFVQSTANCVAGTLGLMGKVTGYNNTHVNQGLTFEAALLDALLLFEEGNTNCLLIGGGEENSLSNYNISLKRKEIKQEIVDTSVLLHSKTKGTYPGEGVTMFVAEANKSTNSKGEIVDVSLFGNITEQELSVQLNTFLQRHSLTEQEIDTVFVGRNGDASTDHFYTYLEATHFSDSSIYVYKNLVGEFNTSSSFATWLAIHLLSGKILPEACKWNTINNEPKNILLYNHYEGKQHGFILIKKV